VKDVVAQIIDNWGQGSMRRKPQKDAPHESTLLLLNCEKAKHRLKWTPLWDVDRAISETVAWYRHVHRRDSASAITESQINAYMAERR
jgi:CDP-glucose 4,6-dehydratase